MLAAMNKTGAFVIYNRSNLNGGVVQNRAISNGGGSGKFIGMPAFDPTTNAVYVGNPEDSVDATYLHGLIALQANASCQLSLLWQQTFGDNGRSNPAVPPTIANGVLWFAEGLLDQLLAFDDANGTLLRSSGQLKGSTTGAPIVVNGQVFIQAGEWVYAFGL
jgi:outer membrane protein assembly factor BamB